MQAEEFYSRDPSPEDYWRGIILFGRNVASYKFALAKALLDLKPESGQLLKMTDLAPTFSQHLTEHLKAADKQTTSRSSRFLDACRRFNHGEIDHQTLIEETVRHGFNNVIDAFHVVGDGEIPKRFYIDERATNGGIRVTDEFSALQDSFQHQNLVEEVESRWRLVETAWELKVSTSLMYIDYDETSKSLFSLDSGRRRMSVTSSRGALNGYQKGKCFYCNGDIIVDEKDADAEVDHFFPHLLKQSGFGQVIDGVWNLVLSCVDCNRGIGGKFARVPSLRLLARLFKRNEYLISSHHPLRETLLQQTGMTESARKTYLNNFHQRAHSTLLHLWEPEEKSESRL
ncbi:hypothetical protein ACFQUU_03615 [Herbaspirillum sp. GCM10030257]|uniref:hypothetical protein n=1 Tax=Herbaspirillum sp. GCM10030257 TaxID=3273393 RepID=UPI00360D271E